MIIWAYFDILEFFNDSPYLCILQSPRNGNIHVHHFVQQFSFSWDETNQRKQFVN